MGATCQTSSSSIVNYQLIIQNCELLRLSLLHCLCELVDSLVCHRDIVSTPASCMHVCLRPTTTIISAIWLEYCGQLSYYEARSPLLQYAAFVCSLTGSVVVWWDWILVPPCRYGTNLHCSTTKHWCICRSSVDFSWLWKMWLWVGGWSSVPPTPSHLEWKSAYLNPSIESR